MNTENIPSCCYCAIQERLIGCNNCDRVVCYDLMGEVDSTPSRPNAPELGACVTIPFSISTNQARFRCPECLWADEASQPDYIINNGPRVDLSLALTDSSVVLVVFYLGSLKVQAELLTRRLSANLAAFGVRITQKMVVLHQELGPQRAEQIRQEMLPRGAYHLVTLFLTDRDIKGRLPTSQNGNEGLQDLDDGAMTERHTNALTSLARDATSARLFLIPCGRYWIKDEVVDNILQTVNSRPWHSVVLLTQDYGLPIPEFTDFLPQLFTLLYFMGSAIRKSLLRTWSRSRSASFGVGLILMSRRDREQESLQISRFEHAPPDSRPFGIDLTETSSQCGCRDQKDVWTSCQISQALELKEDLCFLTSGCGSTELFVALYAGVRRTFDLHGATIMEELWDSQMRRFAFSEADMMVMKVWRRKDGPDKRPIHDKPWTEAGKRNLKS